MIIKLMNLILMPIAYMNVAMTTCPLNLTRGLRSVISSATPSAYIINPPSIATRMLEFIPAGMIIAAIDPRKMPSPPNLGIGLLCTLLSSRGLSIMSHLFASLILSGVVT